jgi:formyl-CoA transferase
MVRPSPDPGVAEPDPVPLPLDGIRVLAVENFIAGPVASMWLADAGAEVVKVERPDGGDQARSVPPLRERDGEVRSMSFIRSNRNKKSIAVDLADPEGRELFCELAAKADVVLENLRPGSMRKLGLDAATLRARDERLVYVSVTGFGQDDVLPSPLTDRGAFDIVGQALSGLMFRPEAADAAPVYLGFPLADLYAATLAACGTYQALFARERTGRGAHVDISLVDGTLFLNELAVVLHQVRGAAPAPGIHGLAAPFGAYRTSDGWVVIAVLGQPTWARFVKAVDIPEITESVELNDEAIRPTRRDLLDAVLEPWLAARRTDEVVALLESHGVPVSRCVDVDEAVAMEHTAARAMLVSIEDPVWGTLRTVANPLKSTNQRTTPATPPPALGAHTEAVLRDWLGWDRAEIDRLQGRGVLGGR